MKSTRNDNIIPQTNREIFELLFYIEVGLREFIILISTEEFGSNWYEKLPGAALQKYKDGMSKEKNEKWTTNIPHHFIYYIDFPHLAEILRNKSWKSCLKNYFSVKNKEVIISSLSSIEPIRNKIAHNRKASKTDFEIVNSAFAIISTSIGKDLFYKLSEKITVAEDIEVKLLKLIKEIEQSYHFCTKFQIIEKLKYWDLIRNEWWFNDDYLGLELTTIKDYFFKIEEYMRLPRLRGEGYKVERWVNSCNLNEIYPQALNTIKSLLGENTNV
jgi:hypothetical protein